MAFTFAVALIGVALLYATLCSCELTAKRTRAQLRAARRVAEARTGTGEDTGAERLPRSAVPSLSTPGTLAAPASRGGL